jgi:hypothetical protein
MPSRVVLLEPPYVSWGAFPHCADPPIFNDRRTPVASVATARGDPFSCAFCDRPASDKRGRYHHGDDILEMRRALAARGARHPMQAAAAPHAPALP